MRILYFSADSDAHTWVPALQTALQAVLPQVQVMPWHSGAPAADYAVVWKPPQQMLDEQPRLKAIFNLGAGVDAVMRLNFSAQTQLVRLDDAGMGAQMAEYVCHALIRHFREFAFYDVDAATRTWAPRGLRQRADFPVGIMGLGVLGERVARAVAQFDFPLVGWSRTPKSLPGVACFSGAGRCLFFRCRAVPKFPGCHPCAGMHGAPDTGDAKHFEPCQPVTAASASLCDQRGTRRALGG
jgi:glyoxylate/hydroxypyruvate reductase